MNIMQSAQVRSLQSLDAIEQHGKSDGRHDRLIRKQLNTKAPVVSGRCDGL